MTSPDPVGAASGGISSSWHTVNNPYDRKPAPDPVGAARAAIEAAREQLAEALEPFIREAMGSGVAYFCDEGARFARDNPTANVPDCLQGWPGRFMEVRVTWVEDLAAAVVGVLGQTPGEAG